MLFMAGGELGDEPTDRIEDRVQSVAVAGEDHPRGERARALLAEGVETFVDDYSRVGLAGAGAFDRLGDAAVDRVRDRFRKLALEPGGRAEMVKEVGVRAANLRRHRLEGDALWALIKQQLSRRGEGGGAAFFRREARTSY